MNPVIIIVAIVAVVGVVGGVIYKKKKQVIIGFIQREEYLPIPGTAAAFIPLF